MKVSIRPERLMSLVLCLSAMAFAGVAEAQAARGQPNTDTRKNYCRGQQTICEKDGKDACDRNSWFGVGSAACYESASNTCNLYFGSGGHCERQEKVLDARSFNIPTTAEPVRPTPPPASTTRPPVGRSTTAPPASKPKL